MISDEFALLANEDKKTPLEKNRRCFFVGISFGKIAQNENFCVTSTAIQAGNNIPSWEARKVFPEQDG